MSKVPRGNKGATAGLPKFDQINIKVVKRLLSYIFKDYKKEFILSKIRAALTDVFLKVGVERVVAKNTAKRILDKILEKIKEISIAE